MFFRPSPSLAVPVRATPPVRSIMAATIILILVGVIMAGEPFMSTIVLDTSLLVTDPQASDLLQATDLRLSGLRLPDLLVAPGLRVWVDRLRDPPEGGVAGR